MIPSFISEYGEIIYTLSEPLSLSHIVHAASGSIALTLAALISIRWIMNRLNPAGCRGKTLMRATFVLWVASLVTGVLINLLT
jgi:uncharacterized membrane protein YozB (DUF420 family)